MFAPSTETNHQHTNTMNMQAQQGRNVTHALSAYKVAWCLVIADRMNKRASQAAQKAGGSMRKSNASFEASIGGEKVRYMTQHAATKEQARARGIAMAEAARRYGAQNVRVYLFTDAQYSDRRVTGSGLELVMPFGHTIKLTERQTADVVTV